MASTYLTRTSGTATSTQKFTVSAWVKQCLNPTGATDQAIWGVGSSNTNLTYLRLRSANNSLQFYMEAGGSEISNYVTNRLFRDVSAWYHIVLAVDTTQTTAANRVKIYVNGVQETSFSSSVVPSVNHSAVYLSSNLVNIGRRPHANNNYFDGSMSHIHFIDGTAYDASAFGETDTTTGEWVGKTSPSVTYGTNGFFILKDGNGITDQSSNSNDFTLGGGTLTDLKDNPDNVFATMNPLIPLTTNYTYSNGNTTVSQSGQSWVKTCSTLGMTSGKYYWEAKYVSGNYAVIGVGNTTTATAASGMPANGIGYKRNGEVQRQGAITNLSTYAHGDIISCYLDMDNEALYYAKNGVMQNSGVPTSGASKTGAFTMPVANSTYFATISAYDGSGGAISMNFGNGYFGTTAITTNSGNGYSGAEGSSKFNYTVPTGYSALSTKGLNE